MSQVIEIHGLTTREEAERRAEDFMIDDVPVEIIETNGTFTVRATYPDDVQLPDAVLTHLAPSQNEAGPPAAPPPQTAGSKTLSPKGAALIKAFESCMEAIPGGRIRAYLDPVRVLTIGWGHTNHNGRQFDANAVWTQAECDAEFQSDMATFERTVNRAVTVPLNQDQYDALVSFTFNLGEGNLRSSTLLRKLNAGDFIGAAQEFKRWNKADGKVLPGLTRRRACEALLFQSIPDGNYDGIPD